jgi:hypothetical protein
LEGDNAFLDSLYEFAPDHRFQLGSSYVMIKGGLRREFTDKELEQKEQRKERAIERRLREQEISRKDVTNLVQQNAQERAENDPLITICNPPGEGKNFAG